MYSLKELLNLSLQEVEIYREYGLIHDNTYWEYYHLWKFGSVKFADHPICKCGECLHNGEPKDSEETMIKTLKKIREIKNS